jgi:AcrR family transcriptional regulator
MMNGTQEVSPQVETLNEKSPAPRAVDWENPRVAAILSAAAKCFARKGFSATTLAEIGKELGLRKSIVHYYFASKAALIHEVQSFTYHKYLDRVKEAIRVAGENSQDRVLAALNALWENAIANNKTGIGLNIEVWSASRRDPELKRRASALQRDARKVVEQGMADALEIDPNSDRVEALSTLILAVLNGLAVTDFLEGEENKPKEAYDLFLRWLQLGVRDMKNGGAQAS